MSNIARARYKSSSEIFGKNSCGRQKTLGTRDNARLVAQELRARDAYVRDGLGGYFLILSFPVGQELKTCAVLIVTTADDYEGLIVEVVLPAQGVVSVDAEHRH